MVRVPAQMREGSPIAEHTVSNLGELVEAFRNYWAVPDGIVTGIQ